jgi:hypothetical protein
VKSSEEIMEILEAYDLTGGFRAAAELAGCDHKTVAQYVALRDAGQTPQDRLQRAMAIDPFLDKVEEWVDRSNGQVRADVVHEKLVAMGFTGSDRSTRRAVAAAKKAWQTGHRRVFRPWIPEPGLWMQFDWGDGPRIAGRRSLLFCGWLAGWPGPGFGSSSRCGIAPCRRCWPAWTRPCARSVGHRRMR